MELSLLADSSSMADIGFKRSVAGMQNDWSRRVSLEHAIQLEIGTIMQSILSDK